MSPDPYLTGQSHKLKCVAKKPVRMEFLMIMAGKLEERELKLIPQKARALKVGEIHELIITDEEEAIPGNNVHRVSYMGFALVSEPGIAATGDKVLLSERGREIGEIAGFDETHMPNHYNIVIKSDDRVDGQELSLKLEEKIEIIPSSKSPFPENSEVP